MIHSHMVRITKTPIVAITFFVKRPKQYHSSKTVNFSKFNGIDYTTYSVSRKMKNIFFLSFIW
jgi:hypothetical protein